MSARTRSSRECQIPGCSRSIISGVLMCPGHWHMVPANLRDDVYRTALEYDASLLLPGVVLRERKVAAYRTAKQAAIDAVVAQLDEDDLPQPQEALRP